jgi:hypothetical protein
MSSRDSSLSGVNASSPTTIGVVIRNYKGVISARVGEVQ